MSNKKSKYPEDFLEICSWVDEKVVKERNILHLDAVEKRQSQMLIIGIMLLMIFIIFAFRDDIINIAAIGVLVLSIIGLIVYTILTDLKLLKKKVDFKNRVLEEFAIHIKDGFTYEKNGEISESKYRKSGFNKSYNEFISNCYMAGDRSGKNIGIANVEVRKRNNSNDEKMETIFAGVFTHVDLKEFTQEIDLMKVNSKRNVKDKIPFEEDKLYMYTEERKYALEIIDSKVMEKIREIKKDFNTTVELMINKQMLFMRFFMTDFNNTLLFASNNEKKLLYKYYRIIDETFELSEIIDDNIRRFEAGLQQEEKDVK